MRRSGRGVGWTAAAVLIVAYALLPVAWIVSLSFRAGDDIQSHRFLPAVWTLENYRTVFRTSLFTSALRNGIGISLIATAISIVLATFAAYAIARLEFRGKQLVLGTALAVAMFPVVSIVGPLFEVWRRVGLYDTWAGLVIPYLSFTLPLSIWVLTAFFRQIPWELEEAALMDGATPWQAFRKVIVPLAAPGVVTAAILTFLFAWNDFVFGISLTSTDRARNVPAALAFFTGASQFQHPAAAIAAAAVVVTVPVIVVVLLFQQRIVAGLTSGAVKG
ncbi:MAG: carbohydrate ABC transporter permease [Anaeromyxobacteraceae bacterium]